MEVGTGFAPHDAQSLRRALGKLHVGYMQHSPMFNHCAWVQEEKLRLRVEKMAPNDSPLHTHWRLLHCPCM
eukprot:1427958-Amphidinium_carterae.1